MHRASWEVSGFRQLPTNQPRREPIAAVAPFGWHRTRLFEVLPDKLDTLEGRWRPAREDVTRFGEEIGTADLPLGDAAVARRKSARGR